MGKNKARGDYMAYSYKGSISFGLVYIPIKLHSCIRENNIGFNLLDKKTKSRIKYKKTCEECNGAEVKPENIVKAYKYDDDKYVIFDNKEFEKLKSPKDKNITIEQFVNLDEIDPIYFDHPYYVEATGAEKAFILLLQVLEKEKKVGIAKSVLGTKETLVALRSKNGEMILNTLFFEQEIQKNPSKTPTDKPDKKELDMAKLIVQSMSAPFEPLKYKDEYHERIERAIEQKIAGKEIVAPKEEKQRTVADLMEALSESLKNIRDSDNIKKPAKTKKSTKKIGK